MLYSALHSSRCGGIDSVGIATVVEYCDVPTVVRSGIESPDSIDYSLSTITTYDSETFSTFRVARICELDINCIEIYSVQCRMMQQHSCMLWVF